MSSHTCVNVATYLCVNVVTYLRECRHIPVCSQRLELESHSYEKLDKKPILTLVWAASANHSQTVTQTVTLFTPVVCRLVAANEPLKWIVCTVAFICCYSYCQHNLAVTTLARLPGVRSCHDCFT